MNIFKQLYKSVYSPKDIASFRLQGIGKTILYVFLLTFLSVIPTVAHLSSALSNGLEATLSTFEEEIPSFTIEEGELIAEQDAPITIERDAFTIIFDSTGEIQKDDLSEIDNGIFFLQNDFVLTTAGTSETFSYSVLTDMTITKEDMIDFFHTMDSLLVVIIPVFFIVIYLFASCVKFIEISILALLGLFLKNMTGTEIAYRHLWRMAAYSVTLPTIFFMIMDIIQTGVPYGFIVNWFVSVFVLYLALREIPSQKENMQ